MLETILSSVSYSHFQNPELTPVQRRVDQTLTALKKQFTDPSFVAATLVGALVFGGLRFGAVRRSNALLNEANALTEASRETMKILPKRFMPARPYRMWDGRSIFLGVDDLKLMSRSLRVVSVPTSVVAGATAQEVSHRSLLVISGREGENPDLFHWEGDNGFKMGWIHSVTGVGPAYYAGEIGGRLGAQFLTGVPQPLRILGIGAAGLLPFLICYGALEQPKP
jgi:hypothetical protein